MIKMEQNQVQSVELCKKNLKAQQIFKGLVPNVTSAMFQNRKLKRHPTFAIAEVAEVALCSSNCTLPTSARKLICRCFVISLLRKLIEFLVVW